MKEKNKQDACLYSPISDKMQNICTAAAKHSISNKRGRTRIKFKRIREEEREQQRKLSEENDKNFKQLNSILINSST